MAPKRNRGNGVARTRVDINNEDFQTALRAVLAREMSAYEAARTFNCSESSIRYHVRRISLHGEKAHSDLVNGQTQQEEPPVPAPPIQKLEKPDEPVPSTSTCQPNEPPHTPTASRLQNYDPVRHDEPNLQELATPPKHYTERKLWDNGEMFHFRCEYRDTKGNTLPYPGGTQVDIIPYRIYQKVVCTALSSKGAYGPVSMKYHCSLCDRGFDRVGDLSKHLNTHVNPESCSFCDFKAKSPADLQRHIQRTHTDPPAAERPERPAYKCQPCLIEFSNPVALANHNNSFHGVRRENYCELCHKGFLTEVFYNKHMLIHVKNGAQRPKCNDCGATFPSKTLLSEHVRREHLPQSPPPKPPTGSPQQAPAEPFRASPGPSHFLLNLQNNPQQIIHRCEYCDRDFISAEKLNIHLQNVHRQVVRTESVAVAAPAAGQVVVASSSSSTGLRVPNSIPVLTFVIQKKPGTGFVGSNAVNFVQSGGNVMAPNGEDAGGGMET